MSPFRSIFGNPVFKRSYNDFSVFSHVSGPRKLKNTLTKALKTFLAAHDEKTHLEITPGSGHVPIEIQMDDPAATTTPSFSPGWPFGRHMETQLSKNTLRERDFMKSLQNVHLCKTQKHPHCQNRIVFFQMGGFPLRCECVL